MNYSKRSKEEIIARILECTIDGATKYQIMYKAYLNYNQIERYLSILLDLKLITYQDSIYQITEKGIQYLNSFNNLRNLNRIPNSGRKICKENL